MIEIANDGLKVDWVDGSSFTFHPLWLRERSLAPTNKDPLTGHRLDEAAFLPLDLRIEVAEMVDGTAVDLLFSDKHRCRFDLDDLRHCIERPYPADLMGEKTLWDATLDPLPSHQFDALSDDRALLDLLNDIARFGIIIVRGLPTEVDAISRLTDKIGPIRQTNWGGIADIRSIADAYDLSMTGRALEPHVDNPYRLPGPGYIFLHCIENSAEGGESLVVDGFSVAMRLKDTNPHAFDTLCGTQVAFRYADSDAILEHFGPLIELSPDGSLFSVRFHNRADQVLVDNPDALSNYYESRRAFAELIWSDSMVRIFKLEPGEAYIVDNYRLFHGRREFDPHSGDRFLRQCYMDRDLLSSKQKILAKRLAH